jgi:hypothetical protein
LATHHANAIEHVGELERHFRSGGDGNCAGASSVARAEGDNKNADFGSFKGRIRDSDEAEKDQHGGSGAAACSIGKSCGRG